MTAKYKITLENIKNAIKEKWYSQKEFAIRSGITETSVSRLLNGARKISLENFIKICYATGKSPNELIGWLESEKQ